MVDSADTSLIVCMSGPKDGVGRTTLTAHLAVALLRQGLSTGLIDLDTDTAQLTRWYHRRTAAAQAADGMVMPAFPVVRWDARSDASERAAQLPAIIDALRASARIILIDAPAGAGPLAQRAMQLSHLVVSVVPESAAEIELLFDAGEAGADSMRPSAYVRMIWEARTRARQRDNTDMRWHIIRNRALFDMAPHAISDELQERLDRAQNLLSAAAGPSIAEHPGWRLCMDEGLTLLDPPFGNMRWTEGNRDQLRACLIALRLPQLEGASFTF
jgi:chromosome partitioning protein